MSETKKYKEGDRILVEIEGELKTAEYVNNTPPKPFNHTVFIDGVEDCIYDREIVGHAPTLATPVPQPQHEYTPGEKVEMQLSCGTWVMVDVVNSTDHTGHTTVKLNSTTCCGIHYDYLRLPIQQPTDLPYVQHIPATELPSDAMGKERFVQEAAMRICAHCENADAKKAVEQAILIYNEIQKQLTQ